MGFIVDTHLAAKSRGREEGWAVDKVRVEVVRTKRNKTNKQTKQQKKRGGGGRRRGEGGGGQTGEALKDNVKLTIMI